MKYFIKDLTPKNKFVFTFQAGKFESNRFSNSDFKHSIFTIYERFESLESIWYTAKIAFQFQKGRDDKWLFPYGGNLITIGSLFETITMGNIFLKSAKKHDIYIGDTIDFKPFCRLLKLMKISRFSRIENSCEIVPFKFRNDSSNYLKAQKSAIKMQTQLKIGVEI